METKKTPLFDGHNDTLTNLYEKNDLTGKGFIEGTQNLQLDLLKAIEVNLVGGFCAIFTPAEIPEEKSYSFGFEMTEGGFTTPIRSKVSQKFSEDYVNPIIEYFYTIQNTSKGKVKVIRNYNELENAIAIDAFSVVLALEGAEAIKEDLSNLYYYYDKGLRSLGLVWSRPNAFGMGAPFCFPKSPNIGDGLTSAGVNLVKRCNDLGIIVDLAHINEKGFWDVAKITNKPLVVTHTCAHKLCPSTRNITDEQIDEVGKSNGIIGVNFEPVSTSFNEELLKKMDIGQAIDYVNNLPISQITKHVEYIANRIGVDHVALGSDFDGAELPLEMKDATGLTKLIESLKTAGFSNEDIDKVACKNWLRVIKDTWK